MDFQILEWNNTMFWSISEGDQESLGYPIYGLF